MIVDSEKLSSNIDPNIIVEKKKVNQAIFVKNRNFNTIMEFSIAI